MDIYWTLGPTNLADIFTKEDKDVAHFESVRDQMVMPRESFRLPIKAKSWGVLERRLDNQKYDSLTKLTKEKEETKIDSNDVLITDSENIIDNDNNRSNNRSIYGDEERITSISKKPIYPSYKDACMNNAITCGRESITYGS